MTRIRGEHGRFCHCGEPATKAGLCFRHYKEQRREKIRASEQGRQRNQPPDFPGLGRIRCDACGEPLRDHSLMETCAAAPISQNTL